VEFTVAPTVHVAITLGAATITSTGFDPGAAHNGAIATVILG
jgi:hypothetical protein